MGKQVATGYTDYFENFVRLYPTPEHRLEAAAKLMVGDTSPGLHNFPSRVQLVARWGESNDALHETALSIYEVRHRAHQRKGQLALSFVRGSVEAVKEMEDWLEDRVVVRIGTIANGDLVHNVARRRSDVPEARQFLAHHMGVMMNGSVLEIDADIVGEPAMRRLEDDIALPVWDGQSPIVADHGAYTRHAQEQRHDVVLGTSRVMQVVSQLDVLTERQGILEQVRQLAA